MKNSHIVNEIKNVLEFSIREMLIFLRNINAKEIVLIDEDNKNRLDEDE